MGQAAVAARRRRFARQPVGQLFQTITDGIRTMPSYASQIPVEDRWAIVLYVRALQRSRNATIEDVPEELRKHLKPVENKRCRNHPTPSSDDDRTPARPASHDRRSPPALAVAGLVVLMAVGVSALRSGSASGPVVDAVRRHRIWSATASF